MIGMQEGWGRLGVAGEELGPFPPWPPGTVLQAGLEQAGVRNAVGEPSLPEHSWPSLPFPRAMPPLGSWWPTLVPPPSPQGCLGLSCWLRTPRVCRALPSPQPPD